MITEKEMLISNDSYTKKDFYQIYPEILELVTKISNRWNPDSSNESDPGIVLLKLLGFIGDKVNYNIDKNVLECFMPSATQEQSMRKLCEMMGYEMQYYNSGIVDITFQYEGNELADGDYFELPAFDTVVSDVDGQVNYILTKSVRITSDGRTATASAIEGTLCDVSNADTTNIILNDLDDNNRLYLPEEMIAQNGIWIRNITSPETPWEATVWHRVTNLNTQSLEGDDRFCYKFGYDSKHNLPYIEFPANIGEIIGAGLNIKYVRTTGATGNVAAKVLTKLADKTTVTSDRGVDITLIAEDGTNILLVGNQIGCSNGVDKETLNSAYNNFKRTVGTFDTLVTCRDYANKIYQLTMSDTDTRNMVSNVQVSDIRDDINRSSTVVTYNDYGVSYETVPESNRIDHSDLVVHPLTAVDGTYNWSAYYNSFKPNKSNMLLIEAALEDYKLASHNLVTPDDTDIFAIKMYADVSARITTTKKVNQIEEKIILNNIKNALYKNFNARQVDFGEMIPYDDILETIQNADNRIKNVALDEPELTPYIMLGDGSEYSFTDSFVKDNYIKLVAKNVVAGKISMLKQNKDFSGSVEQKQFDDLQSVYGDEDHIINKIITNLNITASAGTADLNYRVCKNEGIQLIAPNLKTNITYPAYVNYHWTGSTIAKDAEHKIASGESLKINYTDSNEVPHNIEYTVDKIITDGIEKEVDFNIIRPNFELPDSDTFKSTHPTLNWKKTSGFSPDWQIDGMFSLGTTQQIEHRDYVKTTFSDITKCYWMTKDGYLFHSGETEKILNENEYFFYTDEAENVLVTLGSGTKLTRTDNFTYYIDPNEDQLSEEEVAQKGLGAFTSTKWRTMNYRVYNFTVQEMQIISLSEGDTLISYTGLSSANINNTWKNVTKVRYRLGAETAQETADLPSTTSWQIRSRLDLVVGPETIQTFEYASGKTSTVAVYTTSSSSQAYVELSPTSTQNLSIRCNYTIQQAGNEFIINQTSLVEANLPSLKIKVFEYVPVTSTESGVGTAISLSEYTKIDLASAPETTFNVCIPSNNELLMMFYYAKPSTGVTANPTLTAEGNYLTWYNTTTALTSSITLQEGINVIRITGGSELTLSADTGTAHGSVTFSKPMEVIATNNSVDYEKLGLASTDVPTLLAKIKSLGTVDGKDICFYNIRPDNSVLIDEDTMTDPNAWFDYNNVANKFVITELDSGKYNDNDSVVTAFPHITLTKASRI